MKPFKLSIIALSILAVTGCGQPGESVNNFSPVISTPAQDVDEDEFTPDPVITPDPIPGPAGPAGPAGQDGTDGTDGQDGADGTDGADGETPDPIPTPDPGLVEVPLPESEPNPGPGAADWYTTSYTYERYSDSNGDPSILPWTIAMLELVWHPMQDVTYHLVWEGEQVPGAITSPWVIETQWNQIPQYFDTCQLPQVQVRACDMFGCTDTTTDAWVELRDSFCP